MATATETMFEEKIGNTAGVIWHLLDENGPMSITELVKKADNPRDLVMQALGWLAREEKVVIEEQTRRKIVSLR